MKKAIPAMDVILIRITKLVLQKTTLTGICLMFSLMLLLISCKKENQVPLRTTKNTFENLGKEKLSVTNLDELYAAVNNPDNAGKTVRLEPGVYTLSPAYPNGGRLELQTDMSLEGKPGDFGLVWIDQSSLPAASFVIPAGRTGGIRTGRGTNSLEWLSIKGGAASANPFSVINTDLFSTETSIKISHVFINVNGCNIGVNLRNRASEHAGRKIFAELEENEITGAVNFNGFALAFQNANSASNALIQVEMRGNHVYGNKVGLLAFNSAQTSSIENSVIKITSHADRFEGNGVALDPSSGVNQSTSTTSNNNILTIDMYGTFIRNNNPSPMPPELMPVNGAAPGGIYAACAFNSVNSAGGYNRASNNVMKISLYGCDISQNNGTDINAFAAWCPPACLLAGSNNLLEIYLHGISGNALVTETASSPAEPAGTNVVTVYR